MKREEFKNIAVNGRACAGKDTFADYLVQKYGYKKVTFADPIYWIAKKVFRMKNKNRKLLQSIGQFGRMLYKDIWVKIAFIRVKKLNKQGFNVVISDLRQKNEYLTAVKNKFIPVRVKADLDKRIERAIKRDGQYPDISLWENKSEIGADDFQYIEIDNNDDLESFYRKIDKLMKIIGGEINDSKRMG